MKNPNIARMLKYYRKLNRYSVKDVVDIFDKHNNKVALKTIYGWESGQTQPSADNLMFLCELYKIDNILETFGYGSSSPQEESISLSEIEKEIIIQYRKTPTMQPAILKLLNIEPHSL